MSPLSSRPQLKTAVFMSIAWELARLSTCQRRQVGCVLVDFHGRIVGAGYNGVAADMPHCIDKPCAAASLPPGTGLELCEAIHAEQNALLVCERPFDILYCYTTASPCRHCVKMLLNTSCKYIRFNEEYPHEEAEALWLRAGRNWLKV